MQAMNVVVCTTAVPEEEGLESSDGFGMFCVTDQRSTRRGRFRK